MTMDLSKQGTMSAEMAAAVESALVTGDLSKLTTDQRIAYYRATCDSMGLNYLTKPFDYLVLNQKLVLYANRGTTDQLRALKGVSCTIVSREKMDDVYVVAARATLPDGRYDESTGVVTISNLKGDALANALMKAETKAKRRATLSICGLGWMDETEVETVRTETRPVFQVEVENGQMVERVQGEVIPPNRGPAEKVTCADCGEEVKETRLRDGTVWGPEQLADYGRRKHNRVLCMGHYQQANSARRRAERESEEMPDAPATAQAEQPATDQLTLERETRERLMDGWATIWNKAQTLGIETPPADVSKLTNAQLVTAGTVLRAKVEAELDRLEAAKKAPAGAAF